MGRRASFLSALALLFLPAALPPRSPAESHGGAAPLDHARDAAARRARATSAAAFATASVLESKDQPLEALSLYRLATRHDAGHDKSWEKTALLLMQFSEPGQARTLLEEALPRFPGSPGLHSLLAVIYLRQSRVDDAARLARRALELDPTLISNYRVLVCQLVNQDAPDTEIQRLFQSSASTPSNDSDYFLRLADLWEEVLQTSTRSPTQDIQNQIRPLYQRALELDPGNTAATYRLGTLAYEQGDFAAAADCFTIVYHKRPGFPRIREDLAIALMGSQRYDQAIPILQELVLQDPARTHLHGLLGELCLQSNDWPAAARHLNLYVHSMGTRAQPADYGRLVHAQIQSSQDAAALDTARLALRFHPGHPLLHFYRGLALYENRHYAEAADAFRHSRTLPGAEHAVDEQYYLYLLGSALELSGQPEEGEATLLQCIQRHPRYAPALNYLGFLWADQNRRLPEARDFISRALAEQPHEPAYLDSMGWVLFRLGDSPAALAYLERAAAAAPDNPEIQEHLGDALAALGRHHEALAAWEQAAAIGGTPERLHPKMRGARDSLALGPANPQRP